MRLNVHRRRIATSRLLHGIVMWNDAERNPVLVNPPCSVSKGHLSGRNREYRRSNGRNAHALSLVRRRVTIVRNGKASGLQVLTANHDSLKAGRNRRDRTLRRNLIAEEDNTNRNTISDATVAG